MDDDPTAPGDGPPTERFPGRAAVPPTDRVPHSAFVGFMSVRVHRLLPIRRSTLLMAIAFLGFGTWCYFYPPYSAPGSGTPTTVIPGFAPPTTTTTTTTTVPPTTTTQPAATTTVPSPTTTRPAVQARLIGSSTKSIGIGPWCAPNMSASPLRRRITES